jgi:uncharacterized protein (UPF0262 family)
MADDAHKNHRLQTVELDEESLAAVSRDQEQERQIAIFDLLEENYFAPEGAEGGPYRCARPELRTPTHPFALALS